MPMISEGNISYIFKSKLASDKTSPVPAEAIMKQYNHLSKKKDPFLRIDNSTRTAYTKFPQNIQ
jgi:hypothetical protein